MAGSRTSRIAAIALLLLASAAPGQDIAPSPPPDPNEFLCVGGLQFFPTLAENRDIAASPVPAGFRALSESADPCVRSMLHWTALIDWHLAFGDARSVAPALAYLEAHYLRDLPPPDRYERELRRARRAAPPGRERTRAARHSLESLIEGLDDYLLLTEQYLRAAEAFGSSLLLDKAEQLLRAPVAAGLLLEPLERQPAARLPNAGWDAFRTGDLQMRAAVLRAELTRSPADLARADAVLARFERPIYRTAAELAFGRGREFCDVDPDDAGAEQVRTACRDDDFQYRVFAYWLNRALLDTVAGVDNPGGSMQPPDSVRLTLRLLEREEGQPTIGRCCGLHRHRGERLRLLLARAALAARRFEAELQRGDRGEAAGHWYEALEELRKAERLIAPHEEPARFRRIAASWLSLWGQAGQLDSLRRRVPHPESGPRHYRYAAYLRQLLAGLDAIAVGAAPAAR